MSWGRIDTGQEASPEGGAFSAVITDTPQRENYTIEKIKCNENDCRTEEI